MVTYYLVSAASLIFSILFFLSYNSGKGGALSSIGEKIKYILSIIFFMVFIFSLSKAYYYNNNQQNNNAIQELSQSLEKLQKEATISGDSTKIGIEESQIILKTMIRQLDNETQKPFDTFFNILIGILSAFIGWVIVFTFRNKILW